MHSAKYHQAVGGDLMEIRWIVIGPVQTRHVYTKFSNALTAPTEFVRASLSILIANALR
jgi:hypothetical protein